MDTLILGLRVVVSLGAVFGLMWFLNKKLRSSGAVVSREEIAEHVWDVGFTTDTNVVDVVVRRLRAKVDDPFKTKLIHTIRGVGYVLKGR